MKYWLKRLTFDVFFGFMMYQWIVNGVDGAGNVALFIMWFTSATRFLFGLFGDKSQINEQRPVGFKQWHFATEIAIATIVTWMGYFGLIAFRIVSIYMFEAAREREPKQ